MKANRFKMNMLEAHTPNRLRRRTAPPTPLELLRKKLGRNADLLDAIPVDKVEMEEQHNKNFESYIPNRIYVGSIFDESQVCWLLWAYASQDTRKNGSLEVVMYGDSTRNQTMQQFFADVVLEKADLREEFKCLTYNRNALSAVLKVKK